MRVLHILKIERGVPQILDSFPIVDDSISDDVIYVAEKKLVSLVVGPSPTPLEYDSDEFFDIVSSAYKTGVCTSILTSYHLLWSNIEQV